MKDGRRTTCHEMTDAKSIVKVAATTTTMAVFVSDCPMRPVAKSSRYWSSVRLLSAESEGGW